MFVNVHYASGRTRQGKVVGEIPRKTGTPNQIIAFLFQQSSFTMEVGTSKKVVEVNTENVEEIEFIA
ncbi:unnamed protein product [marine sediment metagenome]|uniref:Uncharacterized protein n=1 Tax=marine sediment metagenome TaxID=412755 RepID=X1GF26_9ZZZZ